jgi:hypothetical protein
LTCTALGVFCIFLQQAFVDIAFVFDAHEDPLLGIDEGDEFVEFGGILDFILGLVKICPRMPFSFPNSRSRVL